MGVLDDLIVIAGEISDRGVDLAERNLHLFSVKLKSASGVWLPASGGSACDPD